MPVEVMHVQTKGQVTIGKRVRTELGIRPGDEVVWIRNARGRWELWKAEDVDSAFDDAAAGITAFSARAKRGYAKRRG